MAFLDGLVLVKALPACRHSGTACDYLSSGDGVSLSEQVCGQEEMIIPRSN